jgi:hypothetical protein
MKLYHYTSREHIAFIAAARTIKVTELHLGGQGQEHAGLDVVWLTKDRNHKQGWQRLPAVFDGTDRSAVRITVEVPEAEAHSWRDWALEHGIEAALLDALAGSGGADDWFVVERPVPEDEWVSVELTRMRSRLKPIEIVEVKWLAEKHNLTDLEVQIDDEGRPTQLGAWIDSVIAEVNYRLARDA